MVKEDKKEKITSSNEESSNIELISTIIPLLTNMFTTNSTSIHEEFEFKQLKELYHSLDKRLAILESKQTPNRKKFLIF